eukprot:TRINITY_DN3874_c0_g1_i1.p1 TRINITY_DN3874_c0_g1~~TRINITY_DN3874_c0_g1_i1.p1  ORF type:complete len:172 (-),score=26.84 TRINITY_DN3874_c0_g1_i1:132-647(-)
MAPLPGVIQIKGDITKISTAQEIISHFKGKLADLVVSDGAPDVTGIHDIDSYIQGQLIVAALNIVTHVLRPGGTFVAKIFKGEDVSLLYSVLKIYFPKVTIVKPMSSRNSSLEAFILCQEFTLPLNYHPTMIDPLKGAEQEFVRETREDSILSKFVACGDLSGYDTNLGIE